MINANGNLSFHMKEMPGLSKQQCSFYIMKSNIYVCASNIHYIFPLPTHIFTKDGKTGNACFH